MLTRVTKVEVLERYRLRLAFSDGAVGEVDLGNELWGEMFEPLQDERLFRQAKLDPELGTVVWPNGADFDPEGLRSAIGPAAPTAKLTAKRANGHGSPRPAGD